MEANRKRWIKSGNEYDPLFPPATGGVYTIRKNASLADTVAFIPKVVRSNLDQTRAISAKLKGDSLYDTCSNIWHFVYGHVQYRKDQNGYEQIRSPARAWHDRREGVDCDCYSVFISSILLNLSIPHILRITKYRQDHFQHIYPVVPTSTGEIIIDCVTNDFDYEVPYSAKKDYPMDLQFLNGLEDYEPTVGGAAGNESVAVGNLGDLGKIRLKSLLNKINKFNPSTILLRNGILASMKLNIAGVAKQLRWSYLTPAQASAKDIAIQKFNKLVSVRKKLESIFYGAGGKLNNLKKAILKGKGNKDKAVIAGLGEVDFGDIDYQSASTPLQQLLGPDIYYSENERTFQGLAGFGELGEPVTVASLTAASGVIVAIAKALKKVGNLFGGSHQPSAATGSNPPEENTDLPASTAPPPAPIISHFRRHRMNTRPAGPAVPSATYNPPPAPITIQDSAPASDPGASPLPAALTTPVTAAEPSPPKDNSAAPVAHPGFWEKNKKWLKPVAIGAGGLALLAIGIHLAKAKPHPSGPPGPPISGLPHHPKNHHRKTKKHPRKKAVALL